MPFQNEHAARQTEPSRYETFRRGRPKGFPAGVDVVYGIRTMGGKKTSEIQTIRFDAKKWTSKAAQKWLKDHGFKTAIERAVKPKKAAGAVGEGVRKSADAEIVPGWVAKRALLWDGVL